MQSSYYVTERRDRTKEYHAKSPMRRAITYSGEERNEREVAQSEKILRGKTTASWRVSNVERENCSADYIRQR